MLDSDICFSTLHSGYIAAIPIIVQCPIIVDDSALLYGAGKRSLGRSDELATQRSIPPSRLRFREDYHILRRIDGQDLFTPTNIFFVFRQPFGGWRFSAEVVRTFCILTIR